MGFLYSVKCKRKSDFSWETHISKSKRVKRIVPYMDWNNTFPNGPVINQQGRKSYFFYQKNLWNCNVIKFETAREEKTIPLKIVKTYLVTRVWKIPYLKSIFGKNVSWWKGNSFLVTVIRKFFPYQIERFLNFLLSSGTDFTNFSPFFA